MKPKAKLINARIVSHGNDAWLEGQVYNHPNKLLPDGTFVKTSRLSNIDLETNIAETKNTIYEVTLVKKENK